MKMANTSTPRFLIHGIFNTWLPARATGPHGAHGALGALGAHWPYGPHWPHGALRAVDLWDF